MCAAAGVERVTLVDLRVHYEHVQTDHKRDTRSPQVQKRRHETPHVKPAPHQVDVVVEELRAHRPEDAGQNGQRQTGGEHPPCNHSQGVEPFLRPVRRHGPPESMYVTRICGKQTGECAGRRERARAGFDGKVLGKGSLDELSHGWPSVVCLSRTLLVA
eukprot:scaffold529_cov308-Pinguiococcus_pyrenoidosus.AAC.29